MTESVIVRCVEFADHLRAAMEQKQMGSRALARAWHPENPEQYRRYVMRYLAGKKPGRTDAESRQIRDELAAALGVDPRLLPLGESTQADMVSDLLAVVRRLEQLEDRIVKREAS